ncbi:MAG: hypothetical protein IIV79_01005, partial [Clostridia bacterium]|nr:hypothetical protein [Clostridia bacterium]
DHVILPDRDAGLTYSQYLRILLFLEDEDMITARIMDLIQINILAKYKNDRKACLRRKFRNKQGNITFLPSKRYDN